ncbi:NIPSNAP family protein [Georgenia yuyongxinii]|uniref:NIPSNAP family protein n=1 Tax=Georgenia yuyongxinii TaxID=2589797 RepID=A0A552WRA5_9MICO|nr:NIPSNAP family protein [Georgenia yuyongxinii]TRW45266.1 NIPSNAP family protein [Georgenia yuyongxinii]
MTYEMRTYVAESGRMPELLTRFEDHTVRLFERHGIRSVAYWTVPDQPDTLVYVVAHSGDPERAWAAFASDPEWLEARARSHEHGPLVSSITSVYLQTTEFSPRP